jgi:hypothetical protein
MHASRTTCLATNLSARQAAFMDKAQIVLLLLQGTPVDDFARHNFAVHADGSHHSAGRRRGPACRL